MKDKFVITKNVTKFHDAVDHINHRLKGIERMALVYSDPGLGKTETALHYAAGNGAVMIRVPAWAMNVAALAARPSMCTTLCARNSRSAW